MIKKYFTILIYYFFLTAYVYAQDPHYSQYLSVPQMVNPAYTGVFNGQMRLASNYRQQWTSFGTPFTSMIASIEGKLFDQDIYYQNPFNAGLILQSDKTLKGALTNNNITASASYHVPLNREGDKSIGVALSGTYGKRNFNFNNLAAASQFESGGFNLGNASGEIAFKSMRPYFSVGAGVLYTNSLQEEGSFFQVGVSAFHVNKPVQTILYSSEEIIPVRVSAQASLQRYVAEDLLLDANLLYQNQAASDYLLTSLSITKLLDLTADARLIGLGCLYRTGDAVAPFVFGEFNSVRIGFSYDIQINNIRKTAAPASSLEFSIQYRFKKNE